MGGSLYPGMGAVLMRAWSDPDFRDRLLSDGSGSLRQIGIAVPDGVVVTTLQASHDVIHLVLGAPPVVVPGSALSDIRDFGCIYRHPSLWSLNWLGRDPVASRRFLDDPATGLVRLGIVVPDRLRVEAASNGVDRIHLVLPPAPPPERWNSAMRDNLAAGRVSSAMRLGRLFGIGAYDVLLDKLAGRPPQPRLGAV